MSHLIDETCCKQRCCNKCDEYRKQLERITDAERIEVNDLKSKIIDNLHAKCKMSKEDDENFDYIEGLYDALRIVIDTR